MDPKTAELLSPIDHPFGTKRWGTATTRRDDGSLVSVVGNPITEITPKGIRLQDGT